ncbi:MAG TPA: hypothetical protein VFW39_09760 [Sphingomicrobium sp.]|nr:hypothetical protein [Sphingomicrobium sp.]
MSDDWIDEPGGDNRSLDERLADMRKREANQAPPYFFPLLGGAVVWTIAGLWLQHKINYPQAYGYSYTCGIRGCWVADLIHSPVLLERPTSYSVALFAWYMSMVAALAWIIVHAARRTPRAKYLMILGTLAAVVGYMLTDRAFQPATWNS